METETVNCQAELWQARGKCGGERERVDWEYDCHNHPSGLVPPVLKIHSLTLAATGLLLSNSSAGRYVCPMEKRKGNLPRLDRSAYRGLAYVHWVFNIEGRKRGWLDTEFFLRFQLLAVHAFLRQKIVAPCVCLMPDHMHMVLIGCDENGSDQKIAVEFLRKQLKPILTKKSVNIQRTPYDHVLRQEERDRDSFENHAAYILDNPMRAGLVDDGESWSYECAIVPGYPDLDIRAADYWDKFWRIYQGKLLVLA